jgi:hypothetical protein
MSSTPLAGPISFSDVKSLTTDKLGYNPPANVSIGTLAGVVRQFGQKAPSTNNIAFSNFYLSTIAGYVIVTTSESFQKYYAALNNGTITTWFRSNTFKKRTGVDNNYYVRVTAQQDGDGVVDTEVKLINWYHQGSNNFIYLPNQDSGNYTVNVTDLTTGALIGSSRVNVAYNGGNQTYWYNA